MFPIPAPPNIDATDDMRKAVVRLFPSETTASRVMPFFMVALTFRHQTSNERSISAWQHGCIDTLGALYLELLAAHSFLDVNPDGTANALHDATRKKVSLLLEAEKELNLVSVAALPRDMAARRSNPTERMIRYCHTRLLGALALTVTYSELKDFFNQNYRPHRAAATAGLSFKCLLQEFSQGKGFGIPVYTVAKELGPDHAKTFEVELTVGRLSRAVASGNSKKHAEEAAADKWLRANAHSYLQSKILENAHARKPDAPKYSEDVILHLDGKMIRAIEMDPKIRTRG